ncbi:MAG: twin-arginine translocase TatA/TatE family subunit [Candidatus Kapaibacterium sp.]
MFDVGGGELILIILAVLVLFGPKKIPEITRMMGKGMQQIKKAQDSFRSQMDDIKSEINNSAAIDQPKQRDFSNPPPEFYVQSPERVKEKLQNLETENFKPVKPKFINNEDSEDEKTITKSKADKPDDLNEISGNDKKKT